MQSLASLVVYTLVLVKSYIQQLSVGGDMFLRNCLKLTFSAVKSKSSIKFFTTLSMRCVLRFQQATHGYKDFKGLMYSNTKK